MNIRVFNSLAILSCKPMTHAIQLREKNSFNNIWLVKLVANFWLKFFRCKNLVPKPFVFGKPVTHRLPLANLNRKTSMLVYYTWTDWRRFKKQYSFFIFCWANRTRWWHDFTEHFVSKHLHSFSIELNLFFTVSRQPGTKLTFWSRMATE